MKGIRQRVYLIITFLCFCIIAKAQTLIINEIMHSNTTGIMDDLNEFPDSWVELYNFSDDTLSTIGLKIGTSSDASLAYTLTDSVKINPHSFYLIYCDKKSDRNHTDFRIKTDSCSHLFLYNSKGEILDHKALPAMLAPNISYGKKGKTKNPSKDTLWGFLMHPTPFEINDTKFSHQLLGNPKFSIKGGLFTKPFYLKITLKEDAPKGTIIRYTTNGDEPTEKSPIFTDSLLIDQTTIIRAKQFAKNWHSPLSKTHSYIFHGRDVTLPVLSLVSDSLLLYDTIQGKGVLSFDYSEDWSAAFRRPANVEYFPRTDSTSCINQPIEFRVGGTGSRFVPLKSLNLYASKRISKKNFDYPFWTEKPNVRINKSIQLRNSGQDFLYSHLRDAICQHSFCPYVHLDYSATQPCIIYINGVYKGILNIRERSNGNFVKANHHPQHKFDHISNWKEVHSGDKEAFNDLVKLYNSEVVNYDTLYKLMDMEEYQNLQILNYIHMNIDFPGNNSILWKEKSNEATQWKWIAKDLDYGLGYAYRDWNYNRSEYLHHALRVEPYIERWSNKENQVKLYQVMMANEKFKNEFIDKTTIYIGDFYSAEKVCAEIDSFVQLIEYEYPYMKALYPNHPQVNHNWAEEIQKMKEWITGRIDYLPYDMQQFFQLGDTISVTLNNETKANVQFSINDIPLITQSFKGKYYQGRTLTISTNGKNGVWKIVKQYADKELIEQTEDTDKVVITADQGTKSIKITFVSHS